MCPKHLVMLNTGCEQIVEIVVVKSLQDVVSARSKSGDYNSTSSLVLKGQRSKSRLQSSEKTKLLGHPYPELLLCTGMCTLKIWQQGEGFCTSHAAGFTFW